MFVEKQIYDTDEEGEQYCTDPILEFEEETHYNDDDDFVLLTNDKIPEIYLKTLINFENPNKKVIWKLADDDVRARIFLYKYGYCLAYIKFCLKNYLYPEIFIFDTGEKSG
jgi:hypothetical protein